MADMQKWETEGFPSVPMVDTVDSEPILLGGYGESVPRGESRF